jgi:hypothetical protein
MNAQKPGNPLLVKVTSYVYFAPIGMLVILQLAIFLVNLTSPSVEPPPEPSMVDGLFWLMILPPLLAFYAVATPLYLITLAVNLRSGGRTKTQKALSISIMVTVAAILLWQVTYLIS